LKIVVMKSDESAKTQPTLVTENVEACEVAFRREQLGKIYL